MSTEDTYWRTLVISFIVVAFILGIFMGVQLVNINIKRSTCTRSFNKTNEYLVCMDTDFTILQKRLYIKEE